MRCDRAGFLYLSNVEYGCVKFHLLRFFVCCRKPADDAAFTLRAPEVWPGDPMGGHFLIAYPAWLVEGDIVEAEGTSQLLIANAEVQWGEFLERNVEIENQ